MLADHWFDAHLRRLVTRASRRDALRLAVAMTVAAVSGEADTAARGKKKRKPKPTPGKAPARCGQGECSAHFNSLEDIDACELKCGRCRIREKFCVVAADAAHPDTHATCCFEQQDCCDGACVELDSDSENCGHCGRVCGPGDLCIGGDCVPSTPCPSGKDYCPYRGCLDLKTDLGNCGACGNFCIATVGGRRTCVNGQCACADPGWWIDPVCGCTPPGYTCCSSSNWCPETHVCRPGGGCDAK